VKKVVGDLKEFGEVQRGLLNVNIKDVNAEIAKEHKLDKIEGVFIGQVQAGGAADQAGIEDNDVIISVNDILVNSVAELQEQIGKHRPGDKVTVVVKRDNKNKTFNVTLRNKHGDTDIVKAEDSDEIFGAKFAEVTEREKEDLQIRYGVKIIELGNGKFKDAGIKKGFIVTQVNKNAVSEVDDLIQTIKKSRGGILVEGIYPNGEIAYYVFGLDSK
jgi:S1-C subfamily serine protease